MLCHIQLMMLILGLSTVTFASQISHQPTINTTTTTATSSGKLNSSTTEHGQTLLKPPRTIKSGVTAAAMARNLTRPTVFIHKLEKGKAINMTQTPLRASTNNTHKDTLVASASLLRPSFMKGLLGGGKRGSSGGGRQPEQEDETEEVTQTIMVPADSSQAEKESQIEEAIEQHAPGGSIKLTKAEDDQEEEQEKTPDQHNGGQPVYPTAPAARFRPTSATFDESSYASNDVYQTLHSTDNKHHHQQQQPFAYQPKPEASLQLTSTEMSSLLNDREAPEFYRERELNGDGVFVGEEPPRLEKAASGQFHSHNSGLYGQSPAAGGLGAMGANGFGYGGGGGDSEAALYTANQHRLHQAATEDGDYNSRAMGGAGGGGGMSSFNHRFGGSFPNAGDVESNMMNGYGGDGSGRLMQSPNEFNEISSYGNVPPGMGGGGGGGGSSSSSSRGGQFPETGGFGGSGGYPNSPVLDRHASEIYGGMGGSMGANAYEGQVPNGGYGGAAAGGGGDMYGGHNMNGMAGGGQSEFYNGRLGQAASHNPYSQSGADGGFADPKFGAFNQMGQASYGGGGEYRNEFGASNALMSQHSHGEGQHHNMMLSGQASSLQSNDMPSSNRLMPLSPTIPVADELYSPKEASSNQLEPSSSPAPFEAPFGGGGGRHHHHRQPQQYSSNSMGRYRAQHSQNYQQQQQAPQQSSGPQVHEAIEDDPTDVSQADEQGSSSSSSGDGQQQQQVFMTTEPTDSDSYAATSTMNTPTQPSDLQQQYHQQQKQQVQAHQQHQQHQQEIYQEHSRVGGPGRASMPINLVLNVPPPAGGGQQRHASNGSGQQGVSPMVEFSRVGSAGYLGPQTMDRRFMKKSSGMQQVTDGHMDQHRYQRQDGSRDPVDNPAHAGKYIID